MGVFKCLKVRSLNHVNKLVIIVKKKISEHNFRVNVILIR
jgi:hypothetical protein